jgi:hypothetical protein
VPLLQVGAVGGHWLSITHCTQRNPAPPPPPPTSQYGVGAAQSMLLRHWTHRWRGEQRGVAVPAQSAPVRHCTHCDVVGSQ